MTSITYTGSNANEVRNWFALNSTSASKHFYSRATDGVLVIWTVEGLLKLPVGSSLVKGRSGKIYAKAPGAVA